MNKVPIKSSSSILSVAYDIRTRDLEVEFITGQTYVYSDVPESVYTDLLKSQSRGSFFNKEIRNNYSSRHK